MRIFRFWKVEACITVIICLVNTATCYAQDENYLKKSIRLTIDNDFLNYRGSGTDQYYTSGLQLEYSYLQKKRKFFIDKLLLTAGNDSGNIAHWSLTQLMYTPINISDSLIEYNDHPYAAALFITRGLTSYNSASNLAFHSELYMGVIGPYSFGKDVQTWVHKAINYIKPAGWNNQIKSDIVLNYNIDVTKQIIKGRELQGDLQLASRIGTLFNDLGIGFGIKAGKMLPFLHCLDNDCLPVKRNKKTTSEVYFYSNGQLKFVLGNSLLQGGFMQSFKDGCADFYHIEEKDLTRVVAIYEMGLVINKSKWGYSFSQHFISKEFKTGKTQLFGRISLLYRFK